MGIIAAAQIAIADITDPIQQDAAPASPSAGMLWLDTGVKPPLLKRWTGSQWETVNDTTEDFRQVEAQLTVMEDNIRTAVTDLSRLETSMLDKADMTQMKELLAGKADADLMLQLSTELKQTRPEHYGHHFPGGGPGGGQRRGRTRCWPSISCFSASTPAV